MSIDLQQLRRKLTPEERQAAEQETIRAAVEGRRPYDAPSGPVTQVAAPESAPDLFNPRDLLALPITPEPFTWPNGKRCWVHPTSMEDVLWLNGRAAAEVRDAGITDQSERQYQLMFRAQVYQVIRVCKQGPEINAKPIFDITHAAALRQNPGWHESIQAICALSDRLGQGQASAEREAFESFFGALQSWAATLPSRLSADGGDRAALESFAQHASHMKLRGRIVTADAEWVPRN